MNIKYRRQSLQEFSKLENAATFNRAHAAFSTKWKSTANANWGSNTDGLSMNWTLTTDHQYVVLWETAIVKKKKRKKKVFILYFILCRKVTENLHTISHSIFFARIYGKTFLLILRFNRHAFSQTAHYCLTYWYYESWTNNVSFFGRADRKLRDKSVTASN